MKFVLAILLCLIPLWGHSQGMQPVGSVVTISAVTGGNILHETFNTGSGYDNTWSASQSSGTVNPDASLPSGPPTGFTGECLNFYSASGYHTWNTTWTAAADKAVTYLSFYLYVNSEGLGNGESEGLLKWLDSGNGQMALMRLRQTAGGQLELYLRVGDYAAEQTYSISTGTGYLVNIKLDNTAHTWEWKMNGSTAGSGNIGPGANFRKLNIGESGIGGYYNASIDTLDIDSSGYIH